MRQVGGTVAHAAGGRTLYDSESSRARVIDLGLHGATAEIPMVVLSRWKNLVPQAFPAVAACAPGDLKGFGSIFYWDAAILFLRSGC